MATAARASGEATPLAASSPQSVIRDLGPYSQSCGYCHSESDTSFAHGRWPVDRAHRSARCCAPGTVRRLRHSCFRAGILAQKMTVYDYQGKPSSCASLRRCAAACCRLCAPSRCEPTLTPPPPPENSCPDLIDRGWRRSGNILYKVCLSNARALDDDDMLAPGGFPCALSRPVDVGAGAQQHCA